MRRVVSFCLWGRNPHYINGAYVALASSIELYPDWEPWFYVAEDVSQSVAERLAANGARVIRMTRGQNRPRPSDNSTFQYEPAFWRFLPAGDPAVARLLVRDSDSPVTPREVAAVHEWQDSDAQFHIMRDHPKHEYPILAGMWGCKTEILRDIEDLIHAWKRFDYYGCDQKFLGTVIYPRILKNAWIHSECIRVPGEEIVAFPTKRSKNEYVGISMTGDERVLRETQHVIEWLQRGSPMINRPHPWSIRGRIRLYAICAVLKAKKLLNSLSIRIKHNSL